MHSTTVPLHPRSSPRNLRTSLRHDCTDCLPDEAVDGVSGTTRSCSIARPTVAEPPSTLATVKDATTKRSAATVATFLHAAGARSDVQGSKMAVAAEQRDAEADILALFDHWQLPCPPPQRAKPPTRPTRLPQTAGLGCAASTGRRLCTAVHKQEGEVPGSSAVCEAVAMLAAVLQHLRKASTQVKSAGKVEAKAGAGVPVLVLQPHSDLCGADAVHYTVITTLFCASC